MSQPLIATWRLTQPYTVAGLVHKWRAYFRIATTTPALTVRARDGVTTFAIDDVIERVAQNMRNVLPTGATFGTALVEEHVGLIWQPRYVHLPTPSAAAGTHFPATQITVTMRDSGFHFVRLVILDGNVSAPRHFATLPATSEINAWLAGYVSTAPNPEAPYFWQVSRSNLYLLDGGFAGITLDLNDKIRRARGLA